MATCLEHFGPSCWHFGVYGLDCAEEPRKRKSQKHISLHPFDYVKYSSLISQSSDWRRRSELVQFSSSFSTNLYRHTSWMNTNMVNCSNHITRRCINCIAWLPHFFWVHELGLHLGPVVAGLPDLSDEGRCDLWNRIASDHWKSSHLQFQRSRPLRGHSGFNGCMYRYARLLPYE